MLRIIIAEFVCCEDLVLGSWWNGDKKKKEKKRNIFECEIGEDWSCKLDLLFQGV